MFRTQASQMQKFPPPILLILFVLLGTVITVITACGGRSAAEDAARVGFERWAKTTTAAYRNAQFNTVASHEDFATVEVTAEFKEAPDAPWIREQAMVQVVRQGDTWTV